MNNLKKILLTVLLCVIYLSVFAQTPHKDYVPNSATAIRIATVLWYQMYGDKIFYNRPFTAKLENDVWIVSGTVHSRKGGAPYAEIRKYDCQVTKIIFYK